MEEELMEKYVKAIQSAIEQAPVKKGESVDVSDLWVITSLPTDLIIECLKSFNIKIPSNIRSITSRGRIIAKNPNYFHDDEEESEGSENFDL